ncbi:MAG: hypothetical protein CVT66_03550 [Actinobacteria bacterium HGW-Actinobacteria-6]|nr:MAG: hypothetical protein CVT66_03550 [Actinobacteria bacterium HGW-Actinobacteria-6]
MDLRSKKTIAMLVGGAVVVALVAGLAVFLVTSSANDEAQKRATAAEEQLASLLASAAAGATTSAETSVPPVTEEASETVDPTAEDGKFFTYITKVVDKNGGTYVTLDYAEFLTGKKAADAAAAAGEESPPPNDYFISNVNPKLREFPADTAMNVTLTSTSDGVAAEGYTVPFGDFQDYFNKVKPGPTIKGQPFWVTITNGTITKIAEQYLP